MCEQVVRGCACCVRQSMFFALADGDATIGGDLGEAECAARCVAICIRKRPRRRRIEICSSGFGHVASARQHARVLPNGETGSRGGKTATQALRLGAEMGCCLEFHLFKEATPGLERIVPLRWNLCVPWCGVDPGAKYPKQTSKYPLPTQAGKKRQ